MKLKNGMDLMIQKAKKEDAQGILEYLNIVGGESDNLLFGANGFMISMESEEEIIQEVNSSKTSALFIGKIGNEIVSVSSLMSPYKKRIEHQADLAISVKKKYWGLGIGTYIMQDIIDFAKENGTTEIIHLGVKAENTSAISLYKKMGFEEIGINKRYFKINGNYYDEILMNLYF